MLSKTIQTQGKKTLSISVAKIDDLLQRAPSLNLRQLHISMVCRGGRNFGGRLTIFKDFAGRQIFARDH